MDIRYTNVSCGYDHKEIVLSEINFACAPGEVVCILGKNGIGKTTLIRALFDRRCLFKGVIQVDGKSVKDLSPIELSHQVAYVPQARKNTFPYPVEDVIMMGRASRIGVFHMPEPKDYELVYETMARLEIEKLKGKLYSNLSGGEQQLVMIARALVQQTKYIVMDEPESNLDLKNQKMIVEIIKELADLDLGVITICHNPDFAVSWDAKLMMVYENKTSAFGSLDEMLTEENLARTYGVPIRVFDVEHQKDKHRKICKLI